MRKMSTILTSLLVILFTNGQASAQTKLDFNSIDTIIDWGSILIPINDATTNDTGENIEKLLAEVNEISTKLENVDAHISIKSNPIWDILHNHYMIATNLQQSRSILSHNFFGVDHYFNDSLKYKPGKSYNNETLQEFANTALYDKDNLIKALSTIRKSFSSRVNVHPNQENSQFSLNIKPQNLLIDCQQQTSSYQLMYYIYIQLIITEMKGLGALRNIYELERWLQNYSSDYKYELEQARINFENGVRVFHQMLTEQSARLPRNVSRCHVNTPKRGVDFLELERFSRIKLFKPDFVEHLRCDCCPYPQASYAENGIEMKVHNCKPLSRIVNACPARNGQRNDYSWWKDNNVTYGGTKSCLQPETFNAGSVTTPAMFVSLPYSRECNNWYCSSDKKIGRKDDTHSWRISSQPQVSDIWNNMVVTGVQFIVRNRTIHLQIQQGKFSDNALVFNDIAWKDVDTYYNVSGALPPIYLDERIGANEKTIYLDDITVPKNAAVTGVQVVRYRHDNHFELYVHATVFNFATGKLKPTENFWCSRHVCEEKIPTGDYIRDRIEVNMGEADNPIRGSGFNYDPQTNKMIKFTHTDAHKDAGQTTIPFIDLQPVQVQPAFPLSGVGFYYRGKEGFGGYIAPRIFTLDVTQRMTAP